ncbi:MAG: redox-regulated ATPase YchF [Candidatus Acidiferrales bacterium]
MKTGIIGLPQVGKTSLFQILTHAHLDARAAHGMHVGVAKVPDERLDKLAPLYAPKKITHATVEYVDVGGLVHDRAKDSAYLTQLRQVDALAHVVRMFDDAANPHPAGKLDAVRDVDSVELDLMLNDLEQIARRTERLEKDLKKKPDPALERELALLTRCRQSLEAERPLRELDFHADEAKVLGSFMFLSQKPMLYVINLSDSEAPDVDRVAEKFGLEKLATRPHTAVVGICGRIEAELAALDDGEAAELMQAYGLKESGLTRLIRATYKLLGLISFFTCGETECRAWTIERGSTAHVAAGAIHTDIQRGFIKAEVVRWDHLLAGGGTAGAREQGHFKLEGKDYVVEDGDTILFRHIG